MDIVDHEKRSLMMANIKSKNTRPEMVLRRKLHANGFRFRLHDRELPGSPDIILPKYKVVIFVHGCFWHRHKGCSKAYSPKSNINRWKVKFESNVLRDAKNLLLLRELGWRVITIWECALTNKEMDLTIDWVATAIKSSEVDEMEWPVPSLTQTDQCLSRSCLPAEQKKLT